MHDSGSRPDDGPRPTTAAVAALGLSVCALSGCSGGSSSPLNQAPTASPQNLATDEEEMLAISLSGTDPDGTITAYSVIGNPVGGTLSGTAPSLTYTPDLDYSGSDTLSFTVTDDRGSVSNPATVSIAVAPMSWVESSAFAEVPGDVPNPERGFYRTIDMNDVGSVARAQQGVWPPGMSGRDLVLFKYFLTEYCGTPVLPDARLEVLDGILNEARDLGMKVVLRIIYSEPDGTVNPCGTTDAVDMTTILGHLDQVAPKLTAHADVIAFVEAGIFGAWGEWNDANVPPGSGLWNDPTNRRTLLDALLEAVPTDRLVLVRRPRFKREVEVGPSPMSAADSDRIGFHNDCALATYDDMGTYDDPDLLVPGLPTYDPTMDLVQNWRLYIAAESDVVPMGGETCQVSSYSPCIPGEDLLADMRFTYLNNEWHWLLDGTGVVNSWETGACFGAIERDLGYRFVVARVDYTDAVPPGGKLAFDVDIDSIGHTAVYNPRPVHVVLRGPEVHELTLVAATGVDPRAWEPGSTTTLVARLRLPANLTEGTYSVRLKLPDAHAGTTGNGLLMANPRYCIRFANDAGWDTAEGENELFTITVDATAVGGVDPTATALSEL